MARRRVQLALFSFAVCAAGLSQSACSSNDREDNGVVRGSTARPKQTFYDFGHVIAVNQTLSSVVSIPATADSPVAIKSVVAETPCCTSAQFVNEIVAPGEPIKIAIRIKAGEHTGEKRFNFYIATDETAHNLYNIVAHVKLYAPHELQHITKTPVKLTCGQTKQVAISLICRSYGDGAEDMVPYRATCEAPVTITEMKDNPAVKLPNNILEIEKTIVVNIPAMIDPGTHRVSLNWMWHDKRTRQDVVVWEVEPLITTAPAVVKLSQHSPERTVTVVIKASDIPFSLSTKSEIFKIIKPQLPLQARKMHTLEIQLADLQIARTLHYLELDTNHPLQLLVKIPILID